MAPCLTTISKRNQHYVWFLRLRGEAQPHFTIPKGTVNALQASIDARTNVDYRMRPDSNLRPFVGIVKAKPKVKNYYFIIRTGTFRAYHYIEGGPSQSLPVRLGKHKNAYTNMVLRAYNIPELVSV